MNIEEIKKRHEESIKDGEFRLFAADIEFLLEQINQLREERDSFQRVGIKVQEVNVRLVEALESVIDIFGDHNGWGSVASDGRSGVMEEEDYATLVKAKEVLQASKLLENDPLQSNRRKDEDE